VTHPSGAVEFAPLAQRIARLPWQKGRRAWLRRLSHAGNSPRWPKPLGWRHSYRTLSGSIGTRFKSCKTIDSKKLHIARSTRRSVGASGKKGPPLKAPPVRTRARDHSRHGFGPGDREWPGSGATIITEVIQQVRFVQKGRASSEHYCRTISTRGVEFPTLCAGPNVEGVGVSSWISSSVDAEITRFPFVAKRTWGLVPTFEPALAKFSLRDSLRPSQ